MVETELLNWTLQQFLVLLVVVTRVGPLIFLMPVFGSRAVPVQVKILVTLTIAFILAPVVDVSVDAMPTSTLGYGIFVLSEVAFAGILALFARFIFAAVQLAGQYVSISMGMGMAAAMDPQFGTQTSLVGVFWNLIATLIFLSLDGHHIFLRVMSESFAWVRPGSLHLTEATFEGILQGVTHMFVLGVKVMAPAGAALFFSHVAMGILAKTVPQIPVMIVAMPMNIGLGFIFIGLSLSYFLPLMASNFDMLSRSLVRLAMGMGG